MNTMQHEFDAVVAHLYKQGKPAMANGDCAYRGKNGTTCAVGCRIPDSLYHKEMEGQVLWGLTGDERFTLPPEFIKYEDMFNSLQGAHDSAETLEDGRFDIPSLTAKLRYIASIYNLTFIPSVTTSV